MGIFGDIADVIIGGALGGVGGAISVFTVEHGKEVVEGTIDVARQIVKIGMDVYRAIPPEAFALAGDPLQGLLKHEREDELIWLGQIAGDQAIFSGLYWPALGPVGATLQIAQGVVPLYITARSLIGKLHHRLMNDQEEEMARYIFRDSLYDRDQIILTNLGGKDGKSFTYPVGPLGPVFVNMGNRYVHNSTILDGPQLFHELTHVWQAKQRVLREIFLYDANLIKQGFGSPAELEQLYSFLPGQQWREYNIERQAGIIEAWALGAIERQHGLLAEVRKKFTIGSPLFRYINGNVRRSDNGARTGNGRSVRQLLADGGHRTMRDMHSRPPPIWWP